MPDLLDLADSALRAFDEITGYEYAPSPSETPPPPPPSPPPTRRMPSRYDRATRAAPPSPGTAAPLSPSSSSSSFSTSTSTAIAVARQMEFHVVDALDGDTGLPVFVVVNDRGDRATCSSHALAERIRRALG